jgi:AraC family transcriptional regulator, transcriptional activator FtrA
MRPRHRVVALAYDRLAMFEFGIVTEAFALPRPELDVPWYDFSVCSIDARPLRATGGITVRANGGLSALRRADTIVIPGWRDADEPPPDALLNALRHAHRRGARLLSICSGVFVLAAAGLLDGRRATTHWRYAERLAARFPHIRVEPDVLYIDEGRVLTSAGSAAGIDLCLHVIRKDHGARIANQVARRLVVAPHRDGGQAQFIPSPMPVESTRGLAALTEWARANLHRRLTVEALARQARMSSRNFARRFNAELGTTPHRWIAHQRLLAAQHRLETTDDSIDRIAEAVGLQTAATLRQHFQQRLGTSPTAYRRRFSVRSVRPSRTRPRSG